MSGPMSYLKLPVDQALGQASVDLYNYLVRGPSSQPEASQGVSATEEATRSVPVDTASQQEAPKEAVATSSSTACTLETHLSSPQDAVRVLEVQKEAAKIADVEVALPDTSGDEAMARRLAEEELQAAPDRAHQEIRHESKKARKEEKEALKELKRLEKNARKEESRRHHSRHHASHAK